MPKSKIIKELVEGSESLEKSMTIMMVLAKDINNHEMEKWAESELSGYSNIMALDRAIRNGNTISDSVYDSRGLIVF
ncbi:MAG: hypothetical protein VZR24_13125 [Butyrivibrio hungatei]|nr:hypothetical protein [Butyrivibrio hungatei]